MINETTRHALMVAAEQIGSTAYAAQRAEYKGKRFHFRVPREQMELIGYLNDPTSITDEHAMARLSMEDMLSARFGTVSKGSGRRVARIDTAGYQDMMTGADRA